VTTAQAETGVALEGGRPAAPRSEEAAPKVKDFEAYLNVSMASDCRGL